MRPLVVIPTYLRERSDYALLEACLGSLWLTTGPGEVDVLIVDDGSPNRDLVEEMERWSVFGTFEVIAKEENEGFSRTVNVGLRRALQEGRDAILCNADIEFVGPWLAPLLATERLDGAALAEVAGARLLFPNGTIQHAGIYFSLLTRSFDHRMKFGPSDLPEALEPFSCPVTGALHLIRHAALERIGVYDEQFRMGYEDVDYCLRVFLEEGQCIYNPEVCAIHHESVFRGRKSEKLNRWHMQSFLLLCEKYATVNFAALVPGW